MIPNDIDFFWYISTCVRHGGRGPSANVPENREQGGHTLGILITAAGREKLATLSRLRVGPCRKYGYITSPCHYCSTSCLRECRAAEEITASEFLRLLC